MAQQDVKVIRSGYEAFNRKDIAAVLELYDPRIEWIEPGGGRSPAGTYRGPQNVASEVFASVPQNSLIFVLSLSSSSTLLGTSWLWAGFGEKQKTVELSTRRSYMSIECATARPCFFRTTSMRHAGPTRGVADSQARHRRAFFSLFLQLI